MNLQPTKRKRRLVCRLFGCRNYGYPIPPDLCEMCGEKLR